MAEEAGDFRFSDMIRFKMAQVALARILRLQADRVKTM
jgi:hypothetical protein